MLCPLPEILCDVSRGEESNYQSEDKTDGPAWHELLRPCPAVHTDCAADSKEDAKEPVRRDSKSGMGVHRGNERVENHAHNRGEEGSHERGSCDGIYRQRVEGDEKGRNHRAAANAVGSADNSDDKGQQE